MNKATRDLMFSSNKGEWATPDDFFDQLNAEFFFTLDAAANTVNHKTPHWMGPGSSLTEDALDVEWRQWGHKAIWLNPPYGRGIGLWVAKAFEEATEGTTVVLLLPARTDTRWFHEFCVFGEIRFIKGRLTFSEADPAPFPSMVVIFRSEPTVRGAVYDWWGPTR